jgi:hypothetical protein
MKLNVECCSGRKADERPVRFWLGGRQYQVETVLDQWYGTTRRASSIKFAPMTAMSILFGHKHRCLMGRGIWFRFGRQERNADASESHVRFSIGLRSEVP